MIKPKALIFSGYGLNCEEETQFVFTQAGARADIMHINDLIAQRKKMLDYQILALPGGFSFGDDMGSGRAFASKIKNHLWDVMLKYIARDKLMIGICNGFQILVNLGFFPGAALLPNDNACYTVRWTDLKIENKSPWFTGIDRISLPIAHGEGKFYATKKDFENMKTKKMIAARYVKGTACKYQFLDANPTGTLDNVAALTNESQRILGIMPHPERAIFFTQLPIGS